MGIFDVNSFGCFILIVIWLLFCNFGMIILVLVWILYLVLLLFLSFVINLVKYLILFLYILGFELLELKIFMV